MLREQIIKDITSINNLQLLNQIFEYVQVMKNTEKTITANKEAVLKFSGTINDKEAEEMRNIIDKEFNNIEGEW